MQEVHDSSQSGVVVDREPFAANKLPESEHVIKHENMMLYEVSSVLSRTLSSGQIRNMQEDLRAAVKRAEASYAKWFAAENERLLRALQPKRATL